MQADIDANVPIEDQQGSSEFWPEGNRTVSALAAVSPTFVEHLLIHPTVLGIVDRVLQPRQPMAPAALEEDDTPPPLAVEALKDGSTQLVWTGPDRASGKPPAGRRFSTIRRPRAGQLSGVAHVLTPCVH